jgi:large subunit ribosomal protein L25
MEYTIKASPRGPKPNPRALRRSGFIPGVLYGHAIHQLIALPAKDLEKLLAQITRSSKVIVELDGQKFPAFIKEIQYDLLTDRVIHVDFYHPAPDRPVTLEVPVRLRGEAKGRKEGGILQLLRDRIKVRGPMDSIPEIVDVDVKNLGIGQSIHVKDLQLSGVQVLTPGEATIVTILAPRKEEVVAAVAGVEGVAQPPAAPAAPAAAASEKPAAAAAPAKAQEAKKPEKKSS